MVSAELCSTGAGAALSLLVLVAAAIRVGDTAGKVVVRGAFVISVTVVSRTDGGGVSECASSSSSSFEPI